MTRFRLHATLFWIVGTDLLFLALSAVLSVVVRIGRGELADYGMFHVEGWLVLFAGVLLGNYVAGTYTLQHRYSRFNLVLQLVFALCLALILVGLISYTWLMTALGRGVLALTLAGYGVASLTFKLFWYGYLSHSQRHVLRVGLLGCGPQALELIKAIENRHIVPRHNVAAVLCPPGKRCDELDGKRGFPVDPDTVVTTVQRLGINVVVVNFADLDNASPYLQALKPLRFEGLHILTSLGAMERFAGRIPLDMADDLFPLLDAVETDLLLFGRMKRMLDLTVGLLAGLVLFLPALFLAAAIKITALRLPVLYIQVRSGQFGRQFRMYKFRSMRPDAESRTGPVWSVVGDARVTRLGRLMRRFRMDEIPQLFNVVKGDMSLVGPRPERPELIDKIAEQIPYFEERLDVLPGLTGWAQIRYPYGDSVDDAARKLEYDLYYIKNMSPLLDLRIILSTMRIVMFGKERVV